MSHFYSIFYATLIFTNFLHHWVKCAINLPTLAPVGNALNAEVTKYLNAKFSVSRKYGDNCLNDLDDKESGPKIITKYFWPGDRVEIECLFCSENALISGKEKIWRTMSIRDGFAFGLQEETDRGKKIFWEYDKFNSPKWKDVLNFSIEDLPELHKRSLWPVIGAEDRPRPRFFQNDGKLIIVNPGIEIQGFYNCYNEKPTLDIVQLLIAMAPMSLTPCKFLHAFSDFMSYFHVSKHYYKFWCQATILPKQQERDKISIQSDVFFDTVWHHRYFPVPASAAVRNLDAELVTEDRESLELKVKFAWSQWSECSACKPFQGWRSREGHCQFMKTALSSDIPKLPLDYDNKKRFFLPFLPKPHVSECCVEDKFYDDPLQEQYFYYNEYYSDFEINILNDVLNTKPFSDHGIRLHSAFILDVYGSDGRGVQIYYKIFNWFKMFYYNMPRVEDNRPKFRKVSNSSKHFKQLVPCFDYRHFDNDTHGLPSQGKLDRTSSRAHMYLLNMEITGGYYFETETCDRSCPKINDYFPP